MRRPPLDHSSAASAAIALGGAVDPHPRSCHQLVQALTHETNIEVRWALVENLGTIRSRARRNGRVTFFLDFRPVGTVWSHRGVPMTDEATAARVLAKIRARVAEGRDLESVLADFSSSDAAPSHVTTLLTKWLDYMRGLAESGQRSPTYFAELERYAGDAGHFSWWRGRSIDDISKRTLAEWRAWLLSQPSKQRGEHEQQPPRKLSPKTTQNVLGAFRSFVVWLVEDRDLLPRVPRFPTVLVDEHVPNILDSAKQAEVLAAIPEDRRGIFLALALCVRPGEARALDVRDYSKDADGIGWLTISKAAKGKAATAPIRGTKTRHSDRIPVTPDLRDWIERHCDLTPAAVLAGVPLFSNADATNETSRWTQAALRRQWESACAKVGVSGVGLYEGTKHTTATHLLAQDVPERVLMALTRHREAKSVRRYAQLHPSALVVALSRATARSDRTDS